jgi:hypothetical protein
LQGYGRQYISDKYHFSHNKFKKISYEKMKSQSRTNLIK